MSPESLNVSRSREPEVLVGHLVGRRPVVSGQEIVASLVPPPQFASATFDSYRPDPDYESQRGAVDALTTFAGHWNSRGPRWFRRSRTSVTERPGLFLDGGFGVGKTHLLASLWHVAPQLAYFGTFIEYTVL